jgi:hypothetical protein
MSIERTRTQIGRWAVAGALLAASASVLLAGCSGVVYPPTYTQAELRAMCERRGGWWRGDLIPGYCEYQAASLTQAP